MRGVVRAFEAAKVCLWQSVSISHQFVTGSFRPEEICMCTDWIPSVVTEPRSNVHRASEVSFQSVLPSRRICVFFLFATEFSVAGQAWVGKKFHSSENFITTLEHKTVGLEWEKKTRVKSEEKKTLLSASCKFWCSVSSPRFAQLLLSDKSPSQQEKKLLNWVHGRRGRAEYGTGQTRSGEISQVCETLLERCPLLDNTFLKLRKNPQRAEVR